jgi:prophage regulatory protein
MSKLPTKSRTAKVASTHISSLLPAAIDMDQVAAYLSLSSSSIERMVRKGEFPAPRQLSGRRVAFLVKEVDEWLINRPVSDQPPPVNCEFGRAGKS